MKAMVLVTSIAFFNLSLAHGGIIRNSYVETSRDFTWTFTWDGVPGPAAFATNVPADFWKSGTSVPGGVVQDPDAGFLDGRQFTADPPRRVAGFDLYFSIRHWVGPHPEDNDPGSPFRHLIAFEDFRGPTGGHFVGIPLRNPDGTNVSIVDHDPHSDFFSLRYKTLPGGEREFEFHGVHDNRPSAVPEPSTLMIAGIAALGLVGYRWQRRNRAP